MVMSIGLFLIQEQMHPLYKGSMSVRWTWMVVYQTAKVRIKVGDEAWDKVVAVSNDMQNNEIVLRLTVVLWLR